jgi:hypothetical protein
MDTYHNINNHIITFLQKNADKNIIRKWKVKQNEFKSVLENGYIPRDSKSRDSKPSTTYHQVMEEWDKEYIFNDIFWENSMLMSPPESYIDIEPPLHAKRLDECPDNNIVLYRNMFSA